MTSEWKYWPNNRVCCANFETVCVNITYSLIHLLIRIKRCRANITTLSSFSSFLGISRRTLHNVVFDSLHRLRHHLVLPSGHVRNVKIGEKFMKIPSEALLEINLPLRLHFEPVLMISAEF